MKYENISILQTASSIPKKIVTNDDLAKMMDTSDEWISKRTGIKQRHVVTEQSTSDLCVDVSQKLLRQANLPAKQIDLISAAAIDFAPALKLVNDRSHYMAEAGQEHPGKMAAVLKANPQVLGDAIQAASKVGTVVPANFNTDEQVVIGGSKQGVDAASKYLKSHGAKIVIPLKVAVASHTPLMQSASDQLSKRLQSVTFKQPEFPIISNTTSQEFELNDIKQILTEQLIKPTHFENCVRKLFALGADTFIELGPGKTLTKLAMKNLKGKKVNFYHIDSSESLNKLREELGD